MNTHARTVTVRAIAVAVRNALFATICAAPMLAFAQEAPGDEVAELVYPTSFFDLGALVVDESSTKFGEYNGLNGSGPYVWANFDVRGGNAHGTADGTTRIEAHGTGLGTTSHNLGFSVADQGRWNVSAGYDQLRHYTTANYQTPYQGSPGDNLFTLLPGFGVVNTTVTTTNGVITSPSKGAQTLTPDQLAAFHTVDVYSQRDNTSFGAGVMFNKEWSFRFDYKRLDQSGAKLIGAGTDAYNLTSAGGFNYGGERVAYLMNPTEYKNDTLNFALNWVGRNAYVTVGYYASLFHDDYNGVSFSNPFVSGGTGAAPKPATGTSPGAAFPISTMSTPPSNQFHQVNATGGYIFDPSLKLIGGVAFAHSTQNASYDGTYTMAPNTAPDLPLNALDGRVDLEHADLRLTWQPAGAWNFATGFKYNERLNKTPVHTYEFLDLGGEEVTVTNIPMSNERVQFDIGGDWRIDSRQKLHVGYEYDRIKRWCDSALANNAQGELSAATAGYYTVASCVQVPNDKESRVLANYRLKVGERVELNVGAAHGRREADVNPSFYNPMQANPAGFQNFGYIAFFDASRKQNLFKAGATWQASHKLTLALNGRHARDDYFESPLGVQDGKTESANVDANYSFAEDNSVGAYFSWQKRTRELLIAQGRSTVALLTTQWRNNLADRDNALGLNALQKGMLGGKFQLREDFTYSLAKTRYVTLLGTNIAPNLSNQGEVPNISSDLKQLRLTGAYQFDHHSSVLAGYLYQRLQANDYYYYAFQNGFTPTSLLPTNQQAPNYSVNSVFAAYRYSFR
jgi:MtrB/PioB family decaheme-associated outer membrane protein